MPWTPRTSAPDVTIKYYRHTGYYVGVTEGVNECLLIDNITGFVMPNCVGYTWGRWYEALHTRPNCSQGDGWTWWGYNDGYARGNTPRVGAIACWKDNTTPGHNGHVAVVEYFDSNGRPVTSNSAYGGPLFFMETLTYDSLNDSWLRAYNPSQYGWQGFIYPPGGIDLKKFLLFMGQRRFPNGRGYIPNNRRF